MPKKPRQNILKIGLAGASGRMGQEIENQIRLDEGLALSAKIDSAADWKKLGADPMDVVIDFSSPEGLNSALLWTTARRKPLVSGTTGLNPKLKAQLKKAAQTIPILYSANMSVGVAVLSAMLESLQGLEDWDFQIEEAHHNQKKDKPSGTALLLQDKLVAVTGSDLPPPNAIRGGGIPGIHQVWAMGQDEVLVVQHTAFNRGVFARGALHAARWLFDKKHPGLYDLSDLYKKT